MQDDATIVLKPTWDFPKMTGEKATGKVDNSSNGSAQVPS
jgi:hypothetical protein